MKRGRKSDETKDLCQSCVNKGGECLDVKIETGETGNIFKCNQYKKANINKLRWRAKVGETYYVIVIKDEKKSMKEFTHRERIEKESRFDSLYHEIGNYFKTLEECEKEIVRWHNLKK